jgi:hypothetical protein
MKRQLLALRLAVAQKELALKMRTQNELAVKLAARGVGLAPQILSDNHKEELRVPDKILSNMNQVINAIDTVPTHNADEREEQRQTHERQDKIKNIHAMWHELTGLTASNSMISSNDDRYPLQQRIQQLNANVENPALKNELGDLQLLLQTKLDDLPEESDGGDNFEMGGESFEMDGTDAKGPESREKADA